MISSQCKGTKLSGPCQNETGSMDLSMHSKKKEMFSKFKGEKGKKGQLGCTLYLIFVLKYFYSKTPKFSHSNYYPLISDCDHFLERLF